MSKQLWSGVNDHELLHGWSHPVEVVDGDSGMSVNVVVDLGVVQWADVLGGESKLSAGLWLLGDSWVISLKLDHVGLLESHPCWSVNGVVHAPVLLLVSD